MFNMPKYNTSFDSDWCNKYSWVKKSTKNSYSAFCKLCNSDISVASRGETAIKQHEGTAKHKSAAKSASQSISLDEHFKSMFSNLYQILLMKKILFNVMNLLFLESSDDLNISRMEIISVYHMVDENQNFRSVDCNSYLIKNVYGNNPKFTCARTKCEAILKGDLF